MNRYKALLLLPLCFAAIPAGATTISLGEQILNGDFSLGLTSWTAFSGSVNIATTGSSINTSTGNAGFDSFFGTPFAVLGDVSGNIGGPPTTATSSLSQTFTLPSTVNGLFIDSYTLDLSFITAFDGDDSSTADKDVFSASLGNITLFSQSSAPLPDCGPSTTCPNFQIVNDPFTTSLVGLAPGTYTITFTLSETGLAGTNTAAGIDFVSILATAHVPAPTPLALLGAGLLGLLAWRRLRLN